ncbi:hypothetical protein [Bacillus sp. D386]|uniref:hypothetical protein n=1 Tax=Bacillus sp. D386 TaxID=2587155 RepID=UPI00112278A4|nr:hypothetical protein [Bacillus sp. D386]
MQIQAIHSGQSLNGKSNQYSVGQIQSVTIKERVSVNTAVVSLKGKEMSMTFENGVPAQNKAQVEITAINNDQLTVKTLSTSQPAAEGQAPTKVEEILKAAGVDASNKDFRQAVQILQEKGYPLSKDSLQTIQRFMNTEAGTVEQKLATITALAERQLEVRMPQLKAIHSALHGESIGKMVSEIGKELPEISRISTPSIHLPITTIRDLKSAIIHQQDSAKITEQVMKFIKDSPDLSQAEKSAILKSLQAGKEALLQILSLIDKSKVAVTPVNMEVSVHGKEVMDLMKSVQKDSSMAMVFAKATEFLSGDSANLFEGIERLTGVVEKATELVSKGRELSARKELMTALSIMQEENPKLMDVKPANSLTESEQNAINQIIQGLNLSSKDVIVTEISKKLSQLTIDFIHIKREITRNLDQSIQMMEQKQPQVKQVLESTIKQLDQAILKGEFMLYTDMSTEKKLLQSSSRLQEAKNLLMSGKFLEANQIVKEVKASVEGLLFKPSDVKVKHFVAGMTSNVGEDVFTQGAKPEQSGRNVLELIRKLGMMNEHEVAKSFLNGKQPEMPQTVKSSLLSILQSDQLNPKLAQQVEQAVQNLTGQQLLAKPDSSGMQNLAMQLPLLLHKEVENVKVFVNSQSDKDQIDWENCSLYFVMETKRLGEIGISLTATNRNLFLTFKSDKEDLQQSMTRISDSSLDRFKEIGYSIGSVQFKPMTVETKSSEREASPTVQTAFTKKGYDITI